jgi:hypothetical protein
MVGLKLTSFILHLHDQILPLLLCIFVLVKHPLTHRLFSGLLALLVLATSVGLTVQQRTCYMSGRSTAALAISGSSDDCQLTSAALLCGPSIAPQLREACCDFATNFHKLSTPATASLGDKFLFAPTINAWLATTVWPSLRATCLVGKVTARWHASDASPPPRAGRVLLAFGCILVV